MDENTVKILDSKGIPIEKPKTSMLAGGAPYDAADVYGEHMSAWNPILWSPDTALNPYRDRIVSRVRDLVRNDGWASGSITRILDNAIGGNYRPISKPDYRALAFYSGNSAFDATWADEFGRVVEAHWRNWSNDPGRYCDAQRKLTVSQIMYTAFRHKLIDGDALAMLQWLPERIGKGRAMYATTIQLIDPDRLSNPSNLFDTEHLRGGVEIDDYGAATHYHIRRAHIGDWFSAADTVRWDRVPRETSWGRPIIVHDFETDRSGQHRGGAGILTPVLQRLKMLAKYDGTELDAAIINAIFGAYVTSPFDQGFVEEALVESKQITAYQEARSDFHCDRKTMLGESRLPILFPGESINTVSAARPNSNFKEFENAMLRNAASGMGISAQQLSQDWSDVNYSSARASLLEAWKTLSRRRDEFSMGFAQPVFSAFLEEVMDICDLPLPKNAPEFVECKAAYSRCTWMGPGRGWIDPVAEKQGAILGMNAGLSTLEQECAENIGQDWEEVLDQREREIAEYKKRNIPLPNWAGIETLNEATHKPTPDDN